VATAARFDASQFDAALFDGSGVTLSGVVTRRRCNGEASHGLGA